MSVRNETRMEWLANSNDPSFESSKTVAHEEIKDLTHLRVFMVILALLFAPQIASFEVSIIVYDTSSYLYHWSYNLLRKLS